MFVAILVLVAVVAFFMWAKAAKQTKRKASIAFLRAFEDRAAKNVREPSWWHAKSAQQALAQVLASIPANSSPYSPDVIRAWLSARMTGEDISTYLYHAETMGFSVSDQIALVPEAAALFLAQDLIKAHGIVDKMIMLRLVATMKTGSLQEIITLPEASYSLVEKFYRDFGATDDGDEEEGFKPTILQVDLPFRTSTFHTFLDLSNDPNSTPQAYVYPYDQRY